MSDHRSAPSIGLRLQINFSKKTDLQNMDTRMTGLADIQIKVLQNE